jgi:hypothetical protein
MPKEEPGVEKQKPVESVDQPVPVLMAPIAENGDQTGAGALPDHEVPWIENDH